MSLKTGFHNCVAEGTQRRTQRAKNMTEALSLWAQREYLWHLLSFRLEPIWHSLSASCDISLNFVLTTVNLFYRLKMLQPSCLHYGSKFLTHPNRWWQRDKPFSFLFCFALSQECLRNSIPVPNEELVFKYISAYLRALLLRNWGKFCVHVRSTEMMLFLLLFYGIFTVGVELIFFCWSALLSLEEQRQGLAAALPGAARDFAHWAFGGVWSAGVGVQDPLILARLLPLAVVPLRLVATTIPFMGPLLQSLLLTDFPPLPSSRGILYLSATQDVSSCEGCISC